MHSILSFLSTLHVAAQYKAEMVRLFSGGMLMVSLHSFVHLSQTPCHCSASVGQSRRDVTHASGLSASHSRHSCELCLGGTCPHQRPHGVLHPGDCGSAAFCLGGVLCSPPVGATMEDVNFQHVASPPRNGALKKILLQSTGQHSANHICTWECDRFQLKYLSTKKCFYFIQWKMYLIRFDSIFCWPIIQK